MESLDPLLDALHYTKKAKHDIRDAISGAKKGKDNSKAINEAREKLLRALKDLG